MTTARGVEKEGAFCAIFHLLITRPDKVRCFFARGVCQEFADGTAHRSRNAVEFCLTLLRRGDDGTRPAGYEF